MTAMITATTTVPDPDGHFDPAYAETLVTNDDVAVEYDWELSEDGTAAELRRTVWRKAYQRRHQIILWQQTAAILPIASVPEHVRDLVSCAAYGTAK